MIVVGWFSREVLVFVICVIGVIRLLVLFVMEVIVIIVVWSLVVVIL